MGIIRFRCWRVLRALLGTRIVILLVDGERSLRERRTRMGGEEWVVHSIGFSMVTVS